MRAEYRVTVRWYEVKAWRTFSRSTAHWNKWIWRKLVRYRENKAKLSDQHYYSNVFVGCHQLSFSPCLIVCVSGLVTWRPPALRAQNCSCSKLCRMSHPLSRSREPTSSRSVLVSSARHNSRRKLPTSNCTREERRETDKWKTDWDLPISPTF